MLIGVSGDTTIYRYDIDHNNCNNFSFGEKMSI